MAYCASCGKEMSEKARFCSQCGKPVAAAQAEEGKEQPPSAGPAVLKSPRSQDAADKPSTDVLWRGSPSPRRHVPMLSISALLLVAAVILYFVFASAPWYTWLPATIVGLAGLLSALRSLGRMLYERLTLRYWLTADRLFVRRGLLRITTDQTELIRVDDITVHQNLFDRIFGIGTVTIRSDSDMSDGHLDLLGVDDPMHVMELIRTGTQNLRRKGGLFIENV